MSDLVALLRELQAGTAPAAAEVVAVSVADGVAEVTAVDDARTLLVQGRLVADGLPEGRFGVERPATLLRTLDLCAEGDGVHAEMETEHGVPVRIRLAGGEVRASVALIAPEALPPAVRVPDVPWSEPVDLVRERYERLRRALTAPGRARDVPVAFRRADDGALHARIGEPGHTWLDVRIADEAPPRLPAGDWSAPQLATVLAAAFRRDRTAAALAFTTAGALRVTAGDEQALWDYVLPERRTE